MTESPAVALAVVVGPLGVLVVHRRDQTPPIAFPGGRIEAGETPAQAAVRETLEETGQVVEAAAVLGERVHPTTGRRLLYVAARLPPGRPPRRLLPAYREVDRVE